jgi:ribonuclease VapC
VKGWILDSWSVLAWIQGEEPAARQTNQALEQAAARKVQLAMCILNMGEVFYTLARTGGMRAARRERPKLLSLPVQLVTVDDDLVWDAAELKARHPVSFADAFCAALARRKELPVMTGDPDFRHLEKRGVVSVRWLDRRP